MKVEQRFVPGVTLDGVWVPCSFLEELAEQDRYDSAFESGRALLAPGRDVKRVCEQHGLLETETRGGVHRGERLAAFISQLNWDGYRQGIPVSGGIPVWLAEKKNGPFTEILGIVSAPEKGRQACQASASQFFGEKYTPLLTWHGDDGHASASSTNPVETCFFQVTRFTVDEIREDTS